MSDFYALLGFARRPLLDSAQLKDSYHRLAADWHPVAAGGDTEKFRRLQEAYQTLREPASRLRHLAALEYGADEDPTRSGSSASQTELFMSVGAVLQALSVFQKRHQSARSALAKAVLHQDKLALRDRILAVEAEVDTAMDKELRELEALDLRWPDEMGEELLSLASRLRFLSRWKAELAEAEFALKSGG